MIEVVGIVYEDNNQEYFFESDIDVKKNDLVIVETESGNKVGKVVLEKGEKEKSELVFPLKKILRLVNENDIKIINQNKKAAQQAMFEAKKIAEELKLNLSFLDGEYSYNRSQLVLYFVADERVDFRELAKKLAKQNKTRIELRQIGVRDKAKKVGGLGHCGRKLCCCNFLKEFNSVSINMAKNQNLALNPTKINGMCGRLLCCLNYENDCYSCLRKELPKVGDSIHKQGVKGKVTKVDVLNQVVTVDNNGTEVEVDYKKEKNNE